MARRARVLVVALPVALALAGDLRGAAASTPDVFGLGSEATALAGAVTARATDFSAAFYNPAGLSAGPGTREVALGLTGYASRLAVRGQRARITDPLGFELGVRLPVPLGGRLQGRVVLGLALHMLPDQIVHIVAHTPEEAFFPYYDNRTQRLLVLPAFGVRITRRLTLGVGFNFLAGLDGKVDASPGATRAIEPRVDEKLEATLKLHAGARFEATDRLALALSYRQGFSVPFRTASVNRVAGLNIDINIDAEGLFTPDEVWAGAALAATPRLMVSLDLGWLRWSAWRGPYVTVSSVLPIAGPFDVSPPVVPYDDIYSVRAGAEWRALEHPGWELRLRAGAGYEPSPLPDQPGVTNLLDSDKIILAAGAGLLLPHLYAQPLRIDAHLMAHALRDRTFVKQVYPTGATGCPATNSVCGLHDEVADIPGTQISNIGYPQITGGGSVWEAGITVTLSL